MACRANVQNSWEQVGLIIEILRFKRTALFQREAGIKSYISVKENVDTTTPIYVVMRLR